MKVSRVVLVTVLITTMYGVPFYAGMAFQANQPPALKCDRSTVIIERIHEDYIDCMYHQPQMGRVKYKVRHNRKP